MGYEGLGLFKGYPLPVVLTCSVSPVHAHLPERLPECGAGEGLDTGNQPDLVEHPQHSLTQLITHVI